MTPLPRTLMEDYRERLAIPGIPDGGPNDIKDEMPYLLGRAQAYPGLRVLEIGVRSGNSTSAFLAAAAASLGGGHVYSIDIAEPAVPASWHDCGYWSFHRSRSLDVVPELLGWPPSYHVLFLDGDHTRANVLAELRKFVPYVARGGLVACHDTKLSDPVRLGLPGMEPYDVARALEEFCGDYHRLAQPRPWEPGVAVFPPTPLTWAERGGWYGLGVIEAPNG